MTFSPGPMTLLLMGFGMQQGLKRSMPVQLGASTAYLVSILIFAVGFAELIKGNPLISQIIQCVAVAYLLYLAWGQWTAGARALEGPSATLHSSIEARFSKGLLTGFSNPKTIVMFGAVILLFYAVSFYALREFLTLTPTRRSDTDRLSPALDCRM